MIEIIRQDAVNATRRDYPICFVKSTLHSVFSDPIALAKRKGDYAHKAFFETKYSNRKEAKDGWVFCQCYTDEEDNGNNASLPFTNRALKLI